MVPPGRDTSSALETWDPKHLNGSEGQFEDVTRNFNGNSTINVGRCFLSCFNRRICPILQLHSC